MLFEHRIFSIDYAGRPMTFEWQNRMMANGSCIVRYGETTVMVNITMSQKPREGIDFFPLSVEYEEKLYRRQNPRLVFAPRGTPVDKAIVTSRVVDRPIRPLFPKDCATMSPSS